MVVLTRQSDILLYKYVAYYLFHNQNIIYNCARGTAQKNLEMDIFRALRILNAVFNFYKFLAVYILMTFYYFFYIFLYYMHK